MPVVGVLIPAMLSGCSSQRRDGHDDVLDVLSRQQAAWNTGDVDGFMAGYWRSDDLTFSSGGTATRGWQATLERYRRRYDTPEKMGRLTFSDLQTRWLADDVQLVLGQWRLDRDDEPIGGRFTLIFQRIAGRWVIVHDHTSVQATDGGN